MRKRALNQKISNGFVWRVKLGANTGVAWQQRAVLKTWPIFAHFSIKRITPDRIHHQVIRRTNPLHIGAELGLPAKIEREMHTQTSGFRQRVDQMVKRCATREREVITLGKISTWHIPGVQTLEISGQL